MVIGGIFTNDDIVALQTRVPGHLVAVYNPLGTIMHELAHWYQWEDVSKRYPSAGQSFTRDVSKGDRMKALGEIRGLFFLEKIMRVSFRI